MTRRRLRLPAFLLVFLLLLPLPAAAADVRDFYDLRGHWAYEEIAFCAEKGFFLGVDEHTFAPDEPISRAMFAVALSRVYGQFCRREENGVIVCGIQTYHGTSFPDVKAGAWYEQAVLWAVDEGILSGMPDGSFSPNESVTRAQIAVMLTRFAEHTAKGELMLGAPAAFSDAAKIPKWAKSAAETAGRLGLIGGDDAGRFSADAVCTRAMAAAVLRRLYVATLTAFTTSAVLLPSADRTYVYPFVRKDGTKSASWRTVSSSQTAVLERNTYRSLNDPSSVRFLSDGIGITLNADLSQSLLTGGHTEEVNASEILNSLYTAKLRVPRFAYGAAVRCGFTVGEPRSAFLSVTFSPWTQSVSFRIGDHTATLCDPSLFDEENPLIVQFLFSSSRVSVLINGAECFAKDVPVPKEASFFFAADFSGADGILFPDLLPQYAALLYLEKSRDTEA